MSERNTFRTFVIVTLRSRNLPAQNAGGRYKYNRQNNALVSSRPLCPAYFGAERALFD